MSLYITQEVLAYVPELKEMVKSASEADGFPVSSKEEALMSSVKVGYMVKVAKASTEGLDLTKIAKASELYGVAEQAAQIVESIAAKAMVKKANHEKLAAEIIIAEDNFQALQGGIVNTEKLTKIARTLYDNHGEDLTLDAIKQYACAGYMEKSATIRALKARHRASGIEAFEKLASAMESFDTGSMPLEDKRKLADFINGLDKKAGLVARGFNIFEEVFMTKKAQIASALMVNITNNKAVPVEKIMSVAPDLVGVLGADVVKELQGDPTTVKSVVESLPLDLKSILAKYV